MKSIIYNLISHRQKCEVEQIIALRNAKENYISMWACLIGVMVMMPMLYVHMERTLWIGLIFAPFIGMIYYIGLLCRRDYRVCKAYAVERGEKAVIFQELLDDAYEQENEIKGKIALIDAMLDGVIRPEEWHWEDGV